VELLCWRRFPSGGPAFLNAMLQLPDRCGIHYSTLVVLPVNRFNTYDVTARKPVRSFPDRRYGFLESSGTKAGLKISPKMDFLAYRSKSAKVSSDFEFALRVPEDHGVAVSAACRYGKWVNRKFPKSSMLKFLLEPTNRLALLLHYLTSRLSTIHWLHLWALSTEACFAKMEGTFATEGASTKI
jgi:hypothetical protein